jgi:PAS domain-containing protein
VSADGEWLIHVSGPPRSGGWPATAQGVVATAVGVIMTLLLVSLVRVLTQGRQHALDLVARRTSELASSEERFRSLAASSPVGILQTDDAGNFQYRNERLCRILGRDAAELSGVGWVEAFVPEDRDPATAPPLGRLRSRPGLPLVARGRGAGPRSPAGVGRRGPAGRSDRLLKRRALIACPSAITGAGGRHRPSAEGRR